jgi:hypothetical protein
MEEASLTGVWDGLYNWPDSRPRTPFTAVLIDTGGALSGSVHEVSLSGPLEGRELTAMISGARSGSSVRFTKTYDAKPVRLRPVIYDGQVNADLTEIEGLWTIPGLWSGMFLMIRPRRTAETAKAGERLTEPVSL